MANYVYNRLCVRGIERDIQEIWEILETERPTEGFLEVFDNELFEWNELFGDKYVKNTMSSEDERLYPSVRYVTELLGSRWVDDYVVEEYELNGDNSSLVFSCTSAWSAADMLYQHLEEYYEVSVDATFQDEFWNFIGVYDSEGYLDIVPSEYIGDDVELGWSRIMEETGGRMETMRDDFHCYYESMRDNDKLVTEEELRE